MSIIMGSENTDSLQEATSEDGGFEFVGQQDQSNIIEIKGDAEVAIVGGSLDDEITTGAGDAIIFAGDGEDAILGGNGSDIIRGGVGSDIIMGGLGNDTLLGGAGDDVIRSGMGEMSSTPEAVTNITNSAEMSVADVLKGGSGADIFEFSASEFGNGTIDQIVDFKDDDFADTIKIFGIGTDGSVTYDDSTGMVSVNGNEAIDIGAGQEVEFEVNDDNGTWSLF